MNFGQALEALKCGSKVSREGWNGKGMFIFLVPATWIHEARWPYPGNTIAMSQDSGKKPQFREYLCMKTAQGDLVPWVASQSDILTSDWIELKAHTITIPVPERRVETSSALGAGYATTDGCGQMPNDPYNECANKAYGSANLDAQFEQTSYA